MKTLLKVVCIVSAVAAGCIAGAVALDQHFHRKFDPVAALNYRGYRGTVVGKKQPGEHRVGIFGGSMALGYGTSPDQSIAGQLQRLLDQAQPSMFTVINLGMNGEPAAAAFGANYRRFDYLGLDSVVFLMTDETITCRFDATSVGQWDLFLERLVRDHPALARQAVEAAGIRNVVEAVDATDRQRRLIVQAFNAALEKPGAIDAEQFGQLWRVYSAEEPDPNLACLANLLLLKPTFGGDVQPVRIMEQWTSVIRTRNRIFAYSNYWFILELIGWEKYFLIRYGDISYGYRYDPLMRFVSNVRNYMSPSTSGTATPRDGERPLTFVDVMRDATETGKRAYIMLFPRKDRGLTGAHIYLDYQFKANDALRVVDLRPVFDANGWTGFLPDSHFSPQGNQRAAAALFAAMGQGVRPN